MSVRTVIDYTTKARDIRVGDIVNDTTTYAKLTVAAVASAHGRVVIIAAVSNSVTVNPRVIEYRATEPVTITRQEVTDHAPLFEVVGAAIATDKEN